MVCQMSAKFYSLLNIVCGRCATTFGTLRVKVILLKQAVFNKTVLFLKFFKYHISSSGKLIIKKDVSLLRGSISVGKNSTLTIEGGTDIAGEINIGENCTVLINRKCHFNNTVLDVQDYSNVTIGEGVFITSDERYPTSIRVHNGTLSIAEKVRIKSDILVRFGGKLSIGKYTGIERGGEVRCEDEIFIGDFGMISYHVLIFDTNTHSTDWQERRKIIEEGYPIGASEKTRPKTKPIHIGDDVWIGDGATVMKGCFIGNRCIIGTRTILGNCSIADDSTVVAAYPRIISHIAP